MDKCRLCGSEEFVIARDTRGLPEARCAKCGTYIRKMNTGEVIEYYEKELKKYDGVEIPTGEEQPLCPACTEYYFTRRGRLGTVYIPIEAKYCPMCGRELKPTDRDY